MKRTLSLILCIALTACDQSQPPQIHSSSTEVTTRINLENNLQAHIEFLADDYLLGRDTGTEQYEIAARYVASHFKQFDMKPAGENNTWFQSVPLVRSSLDKTSVALKVHSDEGALLSYPDEFLIGANPNSTEDKVTSKLVFAGYGINAPALNHNDYANIDVNGKIVVFLSGKPKSFPSELGAHVASGDEKSRYAAEQGAIGVISLHTPERDKVRTYEKMLPFVGRPSFHWLKKDGTAAGTQPSLKVGAYLSKEAGLKLFSAAGADLQAIFDGLAEDKIPQAFDLDIEVTIQRKSKHEQVKSSNVAGIIEGSDPQLKNEYIVYSAHLDHIGTGGMVKEDDHINNGALDNASGIAVMLETARQFALQQATKRSILFVAVTGEEKGLLGSEYFAKNPTVPTDSMIANVNLDMPLILYPFADVIAFGSEHSTLDSYVSRAAEAQGLKLSPDPMPEQNLFVRSDHYSFVKEGVPSIFLVPGFESKQEGIDGQKIFQDFFVQHYHQPSDDTHLEINYEAGATFARVNYQIGKEIANDSKRPAWNENNFFGDTFAKKPKELK